MKWVVNKRGRSIWIRYPVIETDPVRGEKLITGYSAVEVKGVVRNVKLEDRAVVAGIIPEDALVVYLTADIDKDCELVIDGVVYRIERIDVFKDLKKVLAVKR